MLKSINRAVTASVIDLPFSDDARNCGADEFAVNRVQEEGKHDDPHCLVDREGRPPLFQDVFVGTGKWFRQGGASS